MTSPAQPELSSPKAAFDRRAAMAGVRQVVVKVGTNVLALETGGMAADRAHALVEDLVDLHRRGLQVILVTSGAISMGMDRLGLTKKPTFLPEKQACAAVGQGRLMSFYEQSFARFGIATAQVLLTEEDFSSRERYLNLRNTISRLVEYKAIAVINENDTVSTSEIETAPPNASGAEVETRSRIFGDNDRLSALVMTKLGADLLVILSDVDGLFPSRPGAASGSSAAPIPVVEAITPEVEAMAQGGSIRGRGGMASKLRSIRIALDGGGFAVIANGLKRGVLQRVLAGEDEGTIFLPRRRIASRKRWIAHATAPAGVVVVNTGARDAMVKRRTSLLFAGVTGIEGDFKRGDVVAVRDETGAEFARGIVNYSAHDARPLLGKRSSEIAATAGEDYEELITRDNIVVAE